MDPRQQTPHLPWDPFELVSKARRDFYKVASDAGVEPSPAVEECLGQFEHIQRAALGTRMPLGTGISSSSR